MQRPWFFNPTHVNYLTPHHTVVNRYVIIVTYGTSCRANGHLMMYRGCYRFDRAFFTRRSFLFCTPSLFRKTSLGPPVQFQVSKTSCGSSKNSPIPTIYLIHSTPKKSFIWQCQVQPRTSNFTEQYILLVLNLHLNISICQHSLTVTVRAHSLIIVIFNILNSAT